MISYTMLYTISYVFHHHHWWPAKCFVHVSDDSLRVAHCIPTFSNENKMIYTLHRAAARAIHTCAAPPPTHRVPPLTNNLYTTQQSTGDRMSGTVRVRFWHAFCVLRRQYRFSSRPSHHPVHVLFQGQCCAQTTSFTTHSTPWQGIGADLHALSASSSSLRLPLQFTGDRHRCKCRSLVLQPLPWQGKIVLLHPDPQWGSQISIEGVTVCILDCQGSTGLASRYGQRHWPFFQGRTCTKPYFTL
jgi:hypothetical protein